MSEPNQFRQTPGRVLLAFAIVAVLVAIFTVVEAGRRADMEGYDFPTALGDHEWFEFAEGRDLNEGVLRFEDQALFQQKREAVGRFDQYMFKLGRDDSDRGFLYRYEKPRSEERSPQGVYYAKVSDGAYMELALTPRSAEPAAEESGDKPAE